MLTQNNFLADIWASTYRILLGFAISAVVGVPLGILIGSFRSVQALFEPPVSFARYLPGLGLHPPADRLDRARRQREGRRSSSSARFFQLTLLVADISAGIQKELLNIAYTLGASRWQVFTRVLIPASLPGVVDTLRIIIGWAWTYLIVAELVARAIGHRPRDPGRRSASGYTDQIIAGILTIGILGLITDAFFRLLHRLLFPYVERVAR